MAKSDTVDNLYSLPVPNPAVPAPERNLILGKPVQAKAEYLRRRYFFLLKSEFSSKEKVVRKEAFFEGMNRVLAGVPWDCL